MRTPRVGLRPQYQDRYCVFMDILGFRAHMQTLRQDPHRFGEIFSALIWFQCDRPRTKKRWKAIWSVAPPLQLVQGKQSTAFSDCVVRSCPATGTNLSMLIVELLHDWFLLAQIGVFIRGGIARGWLVHTDEVLFGPAMIDAYDTERATGFPRFGVHETAMSDITSFDATWIVRDESKNQYVDFRSFPLAESARAAILQRSADCIANAPPDVQAKHGWLQRELRRKSVLEELTSQ